MKNKYTLLSGMNEKNSYNVKAIISLAFVALFFISFNTLAQNNTSSPYSSYGLGELLNNSNTISTGQTSLVYRSRGELNINNPASLASIDSLRFIFKLQASAKYTNLKQGDDNDRVNDYNLSSVGFGFKATPFYATAISLTPYTSLGYDVTRQQKIDGSNTPMLRIQKGTGGLNQLVWSNGFRINKNLSLGFNGIFIFGNNSREEYIRPLDGTVNAYKSSKQLISKGLHFNVGAQYKVNFMNSLLLLGAKYQPRIGVKAKQKVEVINLNAVRYDNTDYGSFDVPEIYGVALGFVRKKQLWVGLDYSLEKWSKIEKFRKRDDNLRDRSKFSLAMEYSPNDGYATKFLQKLTYRFGAFYDTGYITVKDKEIRATGVSVGLGIPMARGKGQVNVSFEFGVNGTTSNYLVQEQFSRITLGINLFEHWFFKRKYQ